METVRATRRRHSAQLKARIVAACAEPGASVARIALENGLNANLVHMWRRTAEGHCAAAKPALPAPEFMPLPVLPARPMMPGGDIKVSIRCGGTAVDIQ